MKYKINEVKQLRTNFIDRDSWVKVRTAPKDVKCPECKRRYRDIEYPKIALMVVDGVAGNVHLCNDCANGYIKLGVNDIYKEIQNEKEEKEVLITNILEIYKDINSFTDRTVDRYKGYLEKSSIEELKEELLSQEEKKKYKEFIASIDTSDWVLEDYLVEQYGVIMDTKYLKHESQIEDYFTSSEDLFECGQGYYTDEATVIVLIGEKFFEVQITAEINSSKQDRGDRLYWVESIESITYKEIDKPIEEKKIEYDYGFKIKLLKEDKERLDKLIEEFRKNQG